MTRLYAKERTADSCGDSKLLIHAGALARVLWWLVTGNRLKGFPVWFGNPHTELHHNTSSEVHLSYLPNAYAASNSPVNRISRDELPTCTRNLPGSTTQRFCAGS